MTVAERLRDYIMCKRNSEVIMVLVKGFILAIIILAAGCNPATTAVKIGVNLVGDVVVDAKTDQLSHQMIGKNPKKADSILGPRQDTLREVNRPREWLVYPVKGDVLGKLAHVVEVSKGRIVSVMTVEKSGGKIHLPRKIYFQQKLKGKTPRECQDSLNMGPPLITVRSAKTGQLRQLYDARLVKKIGNMQYCVVKYDSNGRCYEANLVEVSASSED
jgi:hypothetical protein